MPIVTWIMQNLGPAVSGPVLDGMALVHKLVQLSASGGIEISGQAGEIFIKNKRGVEIDGLAQLAAMYNIVASGQVEISGEAFVELQRNINYRIRYIPGDTVFTANSCAQYTVVAYFFSMEEGIKYQISNGMETLNVYDVDLYDTCENFLLAQFAKANEMVNILSM